jgi:hypothetical protein
MKTKLTRSNRNASTIHLLTKKRGAPLSWRLNSLRKEYPYANIAVFRAGDTADRKKWMKGGDIA